MTTLNPEFIPESTRALLFDLDDTCQEAIEPKVQQYLDAAAYFGVADKVTRELIKLEWQRNPYPKLVEVLFGSQLYHAALKYLTEHYNEYPKRLYPDTVDSLRQLGKHSLLLGAVTSVPDSVVQKDAAITGARWDELFAYMQTASDTEHHKPDGRVFDPAKQWLGKMGVSNFADVMYIGDGTGDMYAAQNAGLGFIGVTRGFVTTAGFKKLGVTKTISTLSDLLIPPMERGRRPGAN